MQGSDAPRPRAMAAHLRFCKQAAPRSSQTLHRNTAIYLQENVQPRSKRTSPSLVGMQGSDAPRPRATATHLRFRKQAAPRSSQTLHRNTALYLQENAQPRSKRTSLPLVGMQGSDAPRPRATVAHLRFRKQAAPRSSQTLHRNTALYLQENVQPRSKRTSPSLVGMQVSDAPRPRATVTHLRFCKQATSSSSKANQHALPSIETFNRAAKESRCLLRGCRGATLPALARRSRTSDSANKQRPARPKRSIGTLCATLNRNAQPRSKRTSPPLVGMQGSDAPRPRATVAHLRSRKQAAPCSSQTLHRNAVRYPQ